MQGVILTSSPLVEAGSERVSRIPTSLGKCLPFMYEGTHEL